MAMSSHSRFAPNRRVEVSREGVCPWRVRLWRRGGGLPMSAAVLAHALGQCFSHNAFWSYLHIWAKFCNLCNIVPETLAWHGNPSGL